MFFNGSLQDGISTALQHSKLVVCFVVDDGDESQLWENDFLTTPSLKSPLEGQAVALRLLAGSQEAAFLEALFPIPKKPTVVIIENGQLREYIAAGTTKEEFVRRVSAAFNAPTNQSQHPSTAAAAAPAGQTMQQTQPQAPRAPHVSATEDDLYDDDNSPAQDPAQGQGSREVQSMLHERAKRLEADKKAKEAKARGEREARAKERQQTDESNEGQSSNVSSAERSYAEEVRQRKRQAAEERKRILKRIEDDRLERKEREAQERQARLLSSATQDGEGSRSQTSSIPRSRRRPSGVQDDHCNLQVRLFDGSTIRSRFKSDSTLGHDVRRWIDEERTDGDEPYTFRIVLTPFPNKAIDPNEESLSLSFLGLTPSATLVLVPTKHAVAYPRDDGLVWRSLNFILGIFSSGYGLLAGALGGITGMIFGRGGSQPATDRIPLQDLAAERDSRIRGFQNPEDRRRDAQLYNGNSVGPPHADNDCS
ncbi:hypothetical protein F4779DRAFT_226970 [Xylariaceae sp. FL0662B]|nr:hypothetical protein F4779DRAFT_226970 [Xylariaceae sp. FL0662B]